MQAAQPTTAWQRPDWLIAIGLFVLLSAVGFATTSGITSSNDGSHYALTRTLVENRAFALMQFDDFAEGNDIAIAPDGTWYSDRPPGTALMASLFYSLGRVLPDATIPVSRHDEDNPALLYVMLLPIWAGAAAMVVLFALLRELGVVRLAASLTALLLGLTTAHWKYSTVLFSHALSALLILLTVYLAILAVRRSWRWPWFLLIGLLAGLSVLVEYSNALFVALVGVYLLVGSRPRSAPVLFKKLAAFVAGGVPAVVFLAVYNTVNFGAPLTTSYAYAVNYPWAASFSTTFSWPLLPGLMALLVQGPGGGQCDPVCMNTGIALLSPILLAALPGWVLYARRAPREMVFTSAVFLIYLLLFAKHFTSHGFTGDGRYLVPFYGLVAVPLGFTIDGLLRWHVHWLWRLAGWLALAALALVSFHNQMLHIATSYNYTLNEADLGRGWLHPTYWQTLSQATFRNSGSWLLFGLATALLLGVCVVWVKWRHHRQRSITKS